MTKMAAINTGAISAMLPKANLLAMLFKAIIHAPVNIQTASG
jgi:hypothetical protein